MNGEGSRFPPAIRPRIGDIESEDRGAELKIKYLLCPEALVCRPGDSLATTARRMHPGRVEVLAVCIGEDPVGLVSESDLVRALAQAADPQTVLVHAYMTPITHTAEPEEDSWAAAQRMLDLGIRHIAVISDDTLVNIVSVRQLFSVDTRLVDAARTPPRAHTGAGVAGLPAAPRDLAVRGVRPRRGQPARVDTCVPRRIAAEGNPLIDTAMIGDPGYWLDLPCTHGGRFCNLRGRRVVAAANRSRKSTDDLARNIDALLAEPATGTVHRQ
jgi:hypothetical protein